MYSADATDDQHSEPLSALIIVVNCISCGSFYLYTSAACAVTLIWDKS